MGKYGVRLHNIYFLPRVGSSLRWATAGIPRNELPANIKALLAQLDILEGAVTSIHKADNDVAS
jgi:hypothetical protein